MTLSLDKICRDCASQARQGCGSLPEPSSSVIATVNQGVKTKSEPGRASQETGPVGREVEAWGTGGKGERSLQGGREQVEYVGAAGAGAVTGPPVPTSSLPRSRGGFLGALYREAAGETSRAEGGRRRPAGPGSVIPRRWVSTSESADPPGLEE